MPPAVEIQETARMPYVRLRALRVGDQRGLLNFVGANLAAGLYAAKVGDVDLIHDRDEAFWHTLGGDDGRNGYARRGRPATPTIADLLNEDVPELLTLEDAGRRLGIGLEAVDKRIDSGVLYALYTYRRTRLVFAAQVDHLAGQAPAEAAWDAIRDSLPPTQPIPADFQASPVPDPLPIPLDLQEMARWGQAMAIADAEGLCHLVHADLAGGPDAAVYRVEVLYRGRRLMREIPGDGVLPYGKGLAEQHGLGHLMAYRLNLEP